MRSLLPACCLLVSFARAQTGVIEPISESCGPSVVCVHKYANVLPYVPLLHRRDPAVLINN